jgi:hypothetical protein
MNSPPTLHVSHEGESINQSMNQSMNQSANITAIKNKTKTKKTRQRLIPLYRL